MRGTLRLFLCELLHVLVRFMCCSNRDILKGSERRMKIDQSCSNKGKIIQKMNVFMQTKVFPLPYSTIFSRRLGSSLKTTTEALFQSSHPIFGTVHTGRQ